MARIYPTTIEKDEYGRIVYESRSDGFEEWTTYSESSGKIIKIKTKYSNGLIEVEQFADN